MKNIFLASMFLVFFRSSLGFTFKNFSVRSNLKTKLLFAPVIGFLLSSTNSKSMAANVVAADEYTFDAEYPGTGVHRIYVFASL